MDFKFLHAADIHLDSPLHGLSRADDAPTDILRQSTRLAFKALIQLAITEQVTFLILAGDIYDGDWRDFSTGLFFRTQMQCLNRAGISVYMISGNHDAASQISKYLELPDNVFIFSTDKPQSFHIDHLDVSLHGQGYAQRSIKDDLAVNYPNANPDHFNIGVLHTCLNGRPGHAEYAPCSIATLNNKAYDYWALGHVHQREIVQEKPWIVFPGNLQGRFITELGAKGATLVHIVDHEITDVQECHLDVLRWARCFINIAEFTEIDEVYEVAKQQLQSCLDASDQRPIAVRISLTGCSVLHNYCHFHKLDIIEQLRNISLDCQGADCWLEKVELKTSDKSTGSQQQSDHDDALMQLLQIVTDIEHNPQSQQDFQNELKALLDKLPTSGLSEQNQLDFHEISQSTQALLKNRLG